MNSPWLFENTHLVSASQALGVKWSGLFRQVEGEAKIVSDWFLPSLKPYRPAYLDPCQPLRGSLLGANRNVRFRALNVSGFGTLPQPPE